MPANPNLPCAERPCPEPRVVGQTRCAAHHAARARGIRAAARSAPSERPEPPREPVVDAQARLRLLAAQDGATGVSATRALIEVERKAADREGGGDGDERQAVMARGFFFRGQDREAAG